MVPALTNEEETNMSYETRINSLAEESQEEAWDAYYEQERDRLLDTQDGYKELMRRLPHHHEPGLINHYRIERDNGSTDAAIKLRRWTKALARKLAIEFADDRMDEIAEHNEDMASDWRD